MVKKKAVARRRRLFHFEDVMFSSYILEISYIDRCENYDPGRLCEFPEKNQWSKLMEKLQHTQILVWETISRNLTRPWSCWRNINKKQNQWTQNQLLSILLAALAWFSVNMKNTIHNWSNTIQGRQSLVIKIHSRLFHIQYIRLSLTLLDK